MKYSELLEQLQKLTKAQLDCDVTIEDQDSECYAVHDLYITDEFHDSLDVEHPVLRL